MSTVPDTRAAGIKAVQTDDAARYAIDIADIFDIRFNDQRMASPQLTRAKSPRSYSSQSRLGNPHFVTSEDLPPDSHCLNSKASIIFLKVTQKTTTS